jgi:hypothetical protein
MSSTKDAVNPRSGNRFARDVATVGEELAAVCNAPFVILA